VTHLSEETMQQLEQNQLRGKAFAEALLHLNSCRECQNRLTIPSKEEIIEALFDDDDDIFPSGGERAEKQNEKEENSKLKSWSEKIKHLLKNYRLILSVD
jgi:transcription initiation factor IIE alpha subunit